MCFSNLLSDRIPDLSAPLRTLIGRPRVNRPVTSEVVKSYSRSDLQSGLLEPQETAIYWRIRLWSTCVGRRRCPEVDYYIEPTEQAVLSTKVVEKYLEAVAIEVLPRGRGTRTVNSLQAMPSASDFHS